MFTASFGSSQKKPIEVTVHDRDPTTGIGMLVLKTADFEGDFTIFYSDADFLDQILDLGYTIINQCRKLRPEPLEPLPSISFERHVPFAINDAVEHDEAMAAIPDGYDPDQPITSAEAEATIQLLIDAVNKRP